MNKDFFIFWYIWNSHCNMSLLTFILVALFSHLVFRSLCCWLTDKVWISQLNIQPKMLGERAQVIIRYHEKYITRIWSHVSVERRKLTKNIKGYDAKLLQMICVVTKVHNKWSFDKTPESPNPVIWKILVVAMTWRSLSKLLLWLRCSISVVMVCINWLSYEWCNFIMIFLIRISIGKIRSCLNELF